MRRESSIAARGAAFRHPAQYGAWYGVVHASTIKYRVHMVQSMHDDGLFRLNTDVWLFNL